MRALKCAFVFAIGSALFWAITGMGWWTPISGPEDFMRGYTIFIAHIAALAAYPLMKGAT